MIVKRLKLSVPAFPSVIPERKSVPVAKDQNVTSEESKESDHTAAADMAKRFPKINQMYMCFTILSNAER